MHIMSPNCRSQVQPSFYLYEVCRVPLGDTVNVPPCPLHSCSASTCAICLRACTGDLIPGSRWTGSLSPPPDSPPSPLSQSITNASSPCRRRRRDEDSDNIVVKTKDAANRRSGCGQMVCRMCCFEHPQRLVSIEVPVCVRLIFWTRS